MSKDTRRDAPAPMFNIGATKDSLEAVTKCIVDILSVSTCGDGPKQEAMITMRRVAKVENISVSNCTFSGAPVVCAEVKKGKKRS